MIKKILLISSLIINKMIISQCSVHINMASTNCSNTNANSIVANVTGQAPFNYVWYNGDTTSISDTIPFGDTVSVVVTDNLGCIATDLKVFPNFNAPLNLTTEVINNASCISGANFCCDGSLVLNFQDSLLLCPIDNYIVSGGFMWQCTGSSDQMYYSDTITGLANATYTVVPMSSCGSCYYAMTTVFMPGGSSVSLDEKLEKPKLQILPNPTNGILNIEYFPEKNAEPAELIVCNIEGKKMKKFTLPSIGKFIFSLEDLPDGVYIYKFITNKTEIVIERFIIIKNP